MNTHSYAHKYVQLHVKIFTFVCTYYVCSIFHFACAYLCKSGVQKIRKTGQGLQRVCMRSTRILLNSTYVPEYIQTHTCLHTHTYVYTYISLFM